ncbi:MAG: CRISPR-associated RAMP protein Csx7 [Candidatus Methanomethylicia archaeon]
MKFPLWTSSSINLREILLKGYIKNISPLRIGSGREPPLGSLVDLEVVKISFYGNEIPYIPGSSLKGLFRSQAGIIASSLGLDVCSGFAEESCIDIKNVDYEGRQYRLRDLIDECMRKNQSLKAMEYFFEKACVICKIFGSGMYRSKVLFSDAYPLDENNNPFPFKLGSRTGISIDRRTGSAAALYKVEYVEPGCMFKFEIKCNNLPNYALGLLSTIIKMINDGRVKIGGFTSRGYGSAKIENLRLLIRGFDLFEKKTLPSLEENVDEEIYVGDIAEVKDDWLYFVGDNAWKLIDKFEVTWYNAANRIKSLKK